MRFYPRWILANALAELVGLGLTFGLGYVVGPAADAAGTAVAVIAAGVVAIAAGTLFEGVLVGLAQGVVLRQALPAVGLARWARATAIGAFLAWTLGMVPSTILTLTAGGGASGAPRPELGGVTLLLLAAGMGVVVGPILALPQWLELRRHVERAWRWIPANAAAWAVGMVVIFSGTGMLTEETAPASLAAILLTAFLLAGAAVGTVHGAVLVRMLHRPPHASSSHARSTSSTGP